MKTGRIKLTAAIIVGTLAFCCPMTSNAQGIGGISRIVRAFSKLSEFVKEIQEGKSFEKILNLSKTTKESKNFGFISDYSSSKNAARTTGEVITEDKNYCKVMGLMNYKNIYNNYLNNDEDDNDKSTCKFGDTKNIYNYQVERLILRDRKDFEIVHNEHRKWLLNSIYGSGKNKIR